MYKNGEVYSFTLRDGQEILGEFVEIGDRVSNPTIPCSIITVKNHCFVFETPPANPNFPPQKVMVSGTEGGNFDNEMNIYEDKIIYVKPVIRDSELWKLYLQNLDVVEKQEDKHTEYKS